MPTTGAAGPEVAWWWWIALTLVAASAQTARNAMQKGLTGSLGTVGATLVRFVFGLPFAALSLCAVIYLSNAAVPDSPGRFSAGWRSAGVTPDRRHRPDAGRHAPAQLRRRHRLCQDRSDPGGGLRPDLPVRNAEPAAVIAIVTATAGVFLMSWPRRIRQAATRRLSWQPVLMGLLRRQLLRRIGGRLQGRDRRPRRERRRIRIVRHGRDLHPGLRAAAADGAAHVLATGYGTARCWSRCCVPGGRRCWPASWGRWRHRCGSSRSRSPPPPTCGPSALVEILFAHALSRRLFSQHTSRGRAAGHRPGGGGCPPADQRLRRCARRRRVGQSSGSGEPRGALDQAHAEATRLPSSGCSRTAPERSRSKASPAPR